MTVMPPAPTLTFRRLTRAYLLAFALLVLLILAAYGITLAALARVTTDTTTLVTSAQLDRATHQLGALAQGLGSANPDQRLALQATLRSSYAEWRTMQAAVRASSSGLAPAVLTRLDDSAAAITRAMDAIPAPSATASPALALQADALLLATQAYSDVLTELRVQHLLRQQAHLAAVQQALALTLGATLVVLLAQMVWVTRPLSRQHRAVVEALLASQATLAEREARFRLLTEATFEGVLIHEDGRLIDANQAVADLFGYPLERLRSDPAIALLTPESYAEVRRRAAADDTSAYELVGVHRDGRTIPLEARGRTIGAAGRRLRVVALRDLTPQRQAAAALERANVALTARAQDLEQHARRMTLLNELADLLQSCQQAHEVDAVLALTTRELFPHCEGLLYRALPDNASLAPIAQWGRPPEIVQPLAPGTCLALMRGQLYYAGAGYPAQRCEHTQDAPGATLCVPLRDETTVYGLLHLIAPPGAELTAEEQRLAVVVADYVTQTLQNLRLREELLHLSETDPLTGLANRRTLVATLDRALLHTPLGKVVGVIMLDIDHYKRFNDAFGHAAGDAVLRTLGRWLREQMRAGDLICRYGGEEFAIVLPAARVDAAEQRAEQLRAGVADLALIHEGRDLGRLTLSLGVAVAPGYGMTSAALLTAADEALYAAKRTGRNRVVVADLGRG